MIPKVLQGVTCVSSFSHVVLFAEEKKRTRFVVDEGDEVDDAKLLESYRANVETVGDAGKSKKKQRKQNKAKMKLDQQLEKIDKIVEKKQKDAGDN